MAQLSAPEACRLSLGLRSHDVIERDLTTGKSEDLVGLLVDSVRDYAIFQLDPTGRVVSWNQGAQRLKGYRADEIIGKHFSTFYPREDVAAGKCERELAEATDNGRVEDEGWRVRKNGTRFWANVVITALRDREGVLRGFGKVTRDLTERMRAEETLRQSEERLRILVEQVQDYAIFMLDPEGYVRTWNVGAERLKGYMANEIIGKHFSTFYPPESIAARKPELELELAARVGRAEDEGWRVRKDGSRFLTALRDGTGKLTGFAKVTRDVTERFTSAERALVKSEARFRALADNIAQLAWIADPDGAINWYNKRWFEFTGTRFEEMAGWGWERTHHPDHLERVKTTWGRALAAGDPWQDTFPLRGVDGTYRWFLSRAVPVRDDAGKVQLWFGTNTDVTEQRETQEALVEALRARDVFLSIASHELRTPLMPLAMQLQGIVRILEREPDVSAAKVIEKIGKAEKQVAHLERLVNNLLDVSKLSEKRVALDLEPTDLGKLAGEVVDRMRPECDVAGCRVTLDVTGPVLGVWDPARLEQVIVNLISNALKYGRGAPIEVAVRMCRGEAQLAVRDHGIGISPEDRKRIFGRFERAVSEKHYGGFGLGLWISQQVVEGLGGRIDVESAVGQGSTFTVTLPLRSSVVRKGQG